MSLATQNVGRTTEEESPASASSTVAYVYVGLGVEFAFLFIFPVFMKKQFSEWRAAHASAVPSNGWNAIGWSLLGALAFVAIYIVAVAALAAIVIIRDSSKTWNTQ